MCNSCIHKPVCSIYMATGGEIIRCRYRKEQRRGRWEDNHCTVCGKMPMGEILWDHGDLEPPRFEFFMDYCPSCGADMRGKENGDHLL